MTGPVNDRLFNLCNALAAQTWTKLERASTSPVRFSETSITDHNLLVLDYYFPEIRVVHFAAADEVRTGADWEWVIGSATLGWITLRVQAKRAYPYLRTATYNQLGHRGHPARDAKGRARYQYDDLIEACDPTQGQFPLFVFYNGWGNDHPFGGTQWPADGPALPPSLPRDWFGCSVVSATNVKAVVESGRGGKSVSAHLGNSMPWSYLWRAPNPSAAWPSVTSHPYGLGAGLLLRLFELFWLGSGNDDDWFRSTFPFVRNILTRAQEGSSTQQPWWPNPPRWVPMAQDMFADNAPGWIVDAAMSSQGLRPPARIGIVTDLGDFVDRDDLDDVDNLDDFDRGTG